MAPVSWNGSQILYRHMVRPFFLKHEAAVDGMVNNLGGKAMTVAENATREGMKHKNYERYLLIFALLFHDFLYCSSSYSCEKQNYWSVPV